MEFLRHFHYKQRLCHVMYVTPGSR